MTAAPPPARPPRPGRPGRPATPAMPAFEQLDATHRRVLEVIVELDELIDHLEAHGADAHARASARAIHAFFDTHARQHHADEERHVFPPLLAGGDAKLVEHVQRLQQDHGWLEEDWLELSPQIDAVANGYNWYDLGLLRHAVPVFRALYEEHIGLEEALVYPEARKRHAQAQAGNAQRKG